MDTIELFIRPFRSKYLELTFTFVFQLILLGLTMKIFLIPEFLVAAMSILITIIVMSYLMLLEVIDKMVEA